MKIAVDIDDTLTDSFEYFLPFVAEYFGADADELRRKNISYSNLPEEWKKDELGFCRAYYDRVAADTPFKPDAAWGIKELRARGHTILILTGRTPDLYTDPDKTTEEELAKGGIVYDQLLCTLDKAGACVAENVSVLIDDLPANCAAVEAEGIPAILFNSRGNRTVPTTFRRVSNWKEAVEAVISLERDPQNG